MKRILFFLYILLINDYFYHSISANKETKTVLSDIELNEYSKTYFINQAKRTHSISESANYGKEVFHKFKAFYISNMPQIPVSHNERPGSYPFISGDCFRKISHHIYDETNIDFDGNAIKDGDIVFVNTTFLDLFVKYEFHKIQSRFILITHNSNISCPKNYLNLLDNNKIIKWFGNNPDYVHHKFKALPLGLANLHWPHGDISIIRSLINKNLSYEKKYLLIGNFALHTNETSRKEVRDIFCNLDYCTCFSPNKDYSAYLEDLGISKFCLNPFGSGLDCHRMWEALLMNCYPITKSSSLDCLYEELPVVIVKDWNEVNKDFLEKKYSDILKQSFIKEKLFFDYWKNIIFLERNNYLNLDK